MQLVNSKAHAIKKGQGDNYRLVTVKGMPGNWLVSALYPQPGK